jgi:hypothetical protein
MSHSSSIVRGSLFMSAVALTAFAPVGANAQQFIPDIIISSTIQGTGISILTASRLSRPASRPAGRSRQVIFWYPTSTTAATLRELALRLSN